MIHPSDRLYDLLPATYRIRDYEQGESLRALLAILGGKLSEVETDIAELYENWFIETCGEWVVPYIGDLLAVRGLNDVTATAFSRRAYVANTLFYRRRKGTAHVLGVLAGDVTGWPACTVEFFELLQTTQYMNHIRMSNVLPDLRRADPLNRLSSPFDILPHTADVRHIHNRRGRYNIPNIGIFLWRLQNYPLLDVTARQAAGPHEYGYHFSPLGNPAPLFNAPGESGFPDEQKVPAPIRPLDFYLDVKSYLDQFGAALHPPDNSRYYGPERSLQIVKDGTPIPPKDVLCKNLSAWAQPPAGKVAVDAVLGRITFAAGEAPARSLIVSYNYGFSADIGGGPYDRRERLTEIKPPVQEFAVGAGQPYASPADALNGWTLAGKPPAVIRIYDSATYDGGLTIHLPPNGMLVIDCENEERPTLVNTAPLTLNSGASTSEETADFTLSGVVLEGRVEITGKLNLEISDCTLVPGQALDEDGYPKRPAQPSLTAAGTDVLDTKITILRSIVGPLELPEECRSLTIRDSIVCAPTAKDADAPSRMAIAADAGGAVAGPTATLERVTVFGKLHLKEITLASEVIFVHPVFADRRQEGCVRFSHVPDGSQTPRRYRCQPDLAVAARAKELEPLPLGIAERDQIALRVRPQFTALRYGPPAFAQLSSPCAEEIKAGAEDGSEMGAFAMLQQPQRAANLRIALDEYLRFGLEAGIFFAT